MFYRKIPSEDMRNQFIYDSDIVERKIKAPDAFRFVHDNIIVGYEISNDFESILIFYE